MTSWPRLVEDRVDGDRRLAGAAVADDQLALAAADRDHRVDRLDAGLERLLHRLALDDARRLELERAASRVASIGPCPSSGLPSGSTTRPRSASPTGTLATSPGALHRLALRDLLPLAEERAADVVLLEVEREADDVVLELEHLERDAVLEPVDAGDAVAELEDGADLREVGLDVVLLDPLLEDRGDLFGA